MKQIKVENQKQIYDWLKTDRLDVLADLFETADRVRKDNVGDDIHLRGLVEISNKCSRLCAYCGLNAANADINRYALTRDEIISSVKLAVELGYGTVVLQAGEDKNISPEFIADVVREIKSGTELAVTLSLGEWPDEVYRLWKTAGADRYLLKFETSDRRLYRRVHPGSDEHRLEILPRLQRLGFETGSGVMVGLAGQSFETLAEDIFLFAEMQLDMIGIGPFIYDPDSVLGREPENYLLDENNQVPNTEIMALKALALTRIMCPTANLPVTTSLSTLNTQSGLEKALKCGGNVIMPNVTPMQYRTDYRIYPGKASLVEPKVYLMKLTERLSAIGRTVSTGQGCSLKYLTRTERQVQNVSE